MSKVAEQLRQAREAQSLSVYHVAEATKIRTDHIRALDEGNYDVFSAPVYIRGFVRTYAGFLRLDVSSVIAQLNEELSLSDKHHEHPPLTARKRTALDYLMYQLSKLNWRVVLPAVGMAIVLLVGLFIYRAWAVHQARDPLADLGPAVYQPAKTDPGNTLPLPTR